MRFDFIIVCKGSNHGKDYAVEVKIWNMPEAYAKAYPNFSHIVSQTAPQERPEVIPYAQGSLD